MFAGTSGSVAVLVTVSVASSLIVRAAGVIWKDGALFTSLTTTVNMLVALRFGEPLSVTIVANVLVLGPCASVGVQVMTPVLEIFAFVTAPFALLTINA